MDNGKMLTLVNESLGRNDIEVTGYRIMGSEQVIYGHDTKRDLPTKVIISDLHTCHVFLGKKYITAHSHASRVGECLRQERHVGLFD